MVGALGSHGTAKEKMARWIFVFPATRSIPAQLFFDLGGSGVMQGLILKGHAEAHDVHQAFDAAAAKIEKQLRRYKRRIKDRHAQTAHAVREAEAAYTILASPEADNDEEVSADSPPVIAETKAMIPECSVADAVMLLDLQNANGLLFKNGGSGEHNMVYRRHDGSIGWVEPR